MCEIAEFSEGDFIDADEADRLIRAEKGWLQRWGMDYRVRYTKSAPEFIRVEIQTRKAYGRVDSFDTADELFLS